MKQSHQSVALAGLLAVVFVISGCASTRDAGAMSGGSSGTSGSTSTSGTYDAATSTGTDAPGMAMGSAMTSGSSGMHDDRDSQAATTLAATAIPNGTVLAIDTLPAASGIAGGDTSMGSSGASGSSGSGEAYRVTVRLDDGSTQVVNHATTPDFRSGDRINVTNGAIAR